ncbi:hypothetical protein WR25_13547 [Diploscapter pachys]|uniref:Uncharacterized protein n=1 Tax=Diploscapter pachys TaxID=2018661 RepID=A0A2A2JCR7_9BILA|nr:hypothetical protein WR25_13547 [Diploscapter pachys]
MYGGRGIEGVTAAGGSENLGFVPDPDTGGGGANVAASDPPNREPLEPPPNSDPPELGVNNDGAAVVATTGGDGTEIVGIGLGTALVVATVVAITAPKTESSEESIDPVQNIGTNILHPISSETRTGSKAKPWVWTKTESRSELSFMSMKSAWAKSSSKVSVSMVMMPHWSAIIIII